LGCWISPCYGLFSLGVHLETYEPFISLIFQFFSDHSEPQITEAADAESVDMGALLYIYCPCFVESEQPTEYQGG
jgi:hypothetical protein